MRMHFALKAITTSLLAICLIVSFRAAGTEASNPRPVIRTQDQLPRFSYVIQAPAPSVLLSDDEAFAKLAVQVRKDGETLLRDYDIQDSSTRIAVNGTLLNLAMLRGDYEAAHRYIAEVRSIQPKPADQLSYGLRQEAAIAAAQAGGDPAVRSAAFRTNLTTALAPLPWSTVETQVKAWKGAADVFTHDFLLGLIQSDVDPGFKASGRLAWNGAEQVILYRVVDKLLLPYKGDMLATFGQYIAAHDTVKPDIWTARTVSLEGKPGLTPVVIGIWDSGTDVVQFKDKLYTNPAEIAGNGKDDDGNGFVDDMHGVGYGLYGATVERELLHPLSDVDRQREPQLRALFKGYNDLQANIDSAEAQALRQRMAALKPEEVGPVIEDSASYMFYAHGTHVAGIAADSNPAARLLIVRFDEPYQLKPPPFTRAVADGLARHYRDAVAYFKAHNVRVVNMSWILDAATIEQTLELNGVGDSPEARKVQAAATFKIAADALTDAIRGAPQILFVPGSGNSNDDVGFVQSVPAGIDLPNVLTAGAVDLAGDEAAFTSYGDRVRIHTNGVQVESFVPGGQRMVMSGTSMAAPQVVNLAAKLLALDPKLTPEQVIELILKGANRSDDGRRVLINQKRTVELLTVGKPPASPN